MKNSMKHKRLYALLLVFILATSGCSLAPKEEVLPDAPIIPTGIIEQYKKAEVIRGDIIDSVTIDCTYKAFKTEDLNFSINGLRIYNVYVKEGDHVKAGDTLAVLDMSDLDRQLEERSNSIELLNMKLSNEAELKDFAVSTQDRLKGMEGYNSQIDAKYGAEITYREDSIAGLKDALYIEQERLKQLNEQVKQRQIIAGMDGIVSYIADYNAFDVSDKDKKFITIYDPDTLVFVTDGNDSDLFTQGQEVKVLVSDVEYPAVVISPDEISTLKESEQVSSAVYLKAEDKETQLQSNDWGVITFIRNERKDVLYLPKSAIHQDKDRSIVYVEDEGGFKSMKEIKVGLRTDKEVEIISGLNEGDNVILD